MSGKKLRTDATGRKVALSNKAITTYRREGRNLARRYIRAAGRDLTLREIVTQFVGSDGLHATGTISVYRAGLRQLIVDAQAAGFASPELAEDLDALAGSGPRPMEAGPKRTSARKAKSISAGDLGKLIRFLRASGHDLDLFLAVYIYFGLRFFARPIEWSRAKLEEARLLLENAKATNGRAHGKERIFLLDGMSPDQVAGLTRFLSDLARLADAYGSFEKMQKAIARRLTRTCHLAGVRPIAPSTLRHAGMAIAKAAESPEVVAYLAGHISLVTAGRNYAKRRTALPGLTLEVRAPESEIERIRFTGSAIRKTKPTGPGPERA